jgi:hypothetical protein
MSALLIVDLLRMRQEFNEVRLLAEFLCFWMS